MPQLIHLNTVSARVRGWITRAKEVIECHSTTNHCFTWLLIKKTDVWTELFSLFAVLFSYVHKQLYTDSLFRTSEFLVFVNSVVPKQDNKWGQILSLVITNVLLQVAEPPAGQLSHLEYLVLWAWPYGSKRGPCTASGSLTSSHRHSKRKWMV